MDNDFIKVKDIALASVIRSELDRMGIIPKYNGVSGFQNFTKEELASIKCLRLENNTFTDISALEYCVNLKDLVIISANSKKASTWLTSEAYFSYKSQKANIKDFSVISKIKSLQFLTIKDDDNLEELDLMGLTDLAVLELSGNHKLTTVKGLESLTSLLELDMVNNGISHSFDLQAMLENGLSSVNLDFDLYPLLKRGFPQIQNRLMEYVKKGLKCTWSENLSDIRTNRISTMRMERLDSKVKEILNSIIGPDYSDIEKIVAIYLYIVQNVRYDHESLKASKGEENEALKSAKANLGELASVILDRRQSSFNAVLEGKAVCEGYTNMMHYLLKTVGINSMTVHCNSNKNVKVVGHDSNHSVIKVEFGGNFYYFDPTWDAGKSTLQNFFKTKDEFVRNHALSMTESEVSSSQNPFTNEQLSKIFDKVMIDRDSRKNEWQNALCLLENNQLEFLQNEYRKVTQEIENLMTRSPHDPKLEQLFLERDTLNNLIEDLMKQRNLLQEKKAEEDRRILAKLEQMLGFQISLVNGYIYDSKLGVPKVILKDRYTLAEDWKSIEERLKKFYESGQLDLMTYNRMIEALKATYGTILSREDTKVEPVEMKINKQYIEQMKLEFEKWLERAEEVMKTEQIEASRRIL